MESPQSSVLVDPLADFSLVSLFPRTFNQRDVDPDPNPRCNDPLEDIGAHLESMALKNPSRLLEEAKSILDGGLESLNVDNLENVGTHDSEGDVPGIRNANLKGNVENLKHARDEDHVGDIRGEKQENVKGRRPGLGRKKARFSLKPVSSQPTEFVPYVDMDKLSDPEEFFAALEKQENAKDEWRRQSGQPLMDLDQNVPHKGERRRRPGLLGKSATYKHRVSIAPSVDNYTFLSSQETLSQELCSPTPSDHVLQPEQSAVLPLSSTREGAGKANAEKERPNGISDELPSQEEKDDGADEIIAMLQKRFKPIEIPESCLPELNSIFENEIKTIGEPVQDSHDIMSDLHNVVSAIGKETTLGCDSVERRLGRSSISPTPPKSPYSSISLLKARLFQSRKEKDNFSALDIDVSPLAKATSSQDASDRAARRSKKSVKDYKGNSMMPVVSSDFIEYTKLDDGPVEHGEMDMDPKSPLHEKESDTANILETAEDISKTLGVNSDGIMQDDFDHAFSRDQSPKPAAHSKESNVVHKDVCDFDAEKLAPCQETMGDSSIVSDTALNTSPQVDFDNDIMSDNTRDGVSEDNPSDVFDGAAISAKHAEPDVRVLDKDVQVCNIEKSNNNKEQSTVIAIDNLEKHGSSSDRIKLSTAGAVGGDLDHDRPSSSSSRPLEKTPKASSKKSESKRSKARAKTRAAVTRKPSRESEFCSRNTLLGCGTQWETGVRRSTRIRTRPLEYWKGEKLLYGRIHDGLITVVGTKYYSPGKETGNASLKVKSYVSDEYKDFVEWVGLH